MKPIDPVTLATLVAAKAASTGDPGLELQARLWQLLLPLPETADAGTVSAAQLRGAPSESQGSERDKRERDPTSEITSAAYVLASTVQQLSLQRYADGTQQTALQDRPGEQAFNVHIETADPDNGMATVAVWNPELGDVGLEVEWSNGAVRVIATADSSRSAEVLQEGQALLAERLLSQGVALEALDVVVRKRPGKHAGRARTRNSREQARKRES